MVQVKGTLPAIQGKESFDELVEKLASVINDLVDKPITFEEFRTSHAHVLKGLVRHLYKHAHHPALAAALAALKGHFAALEADDDQGIYAARGAACEATALKLITKLADREAVDLLLYELPAVEQNEEGLGDARAESDLALSNSGGERAPLLDAGNDPEAIPARSMYDGVSEATQDDAEAKNDLAAHFEGMNALEIAAVSGAKQFLSQRPIQRIINAIWQGDIIFWPNLKLDATKRAQIYQRRTTDPYCRLRVPVYLKVFEVLFFIAFLVLYYIVLVQRSFNTIPAAEILLYIWIASFAYNELGEFWDAGTTFYLSDFWSAWDVLIVAISIAFFVARIWGLRAGDHNITDTAFDILSLEALFLVPRICSLLSLHPYFGTLIPCLTAMTGEFIKFLSLVAILYGGFLTTFCLLARGYFTFRQMSLILVKVFFGSSYLGFDVAEKISPYLGLPLMLIFVCLTQILLITSLISILSNSLTKVIEHARDEYLFVYSVFVLEASTSTRLTYFLPPLNLIPLAIRPLRLVLSAEQMRNTRIILLKMTHFPHVLSISLYERLRQSFRSGKPNEVGLGSLRGASNSNPAWRKSALSTRMSASPYPLVAPNLKRDSRDEPHDILTSDAPDASAFSSEDMKAVLENLTAEIESLKMMLRQQDDRPGSSDS